MFSATRALSFSVISAEFAEVARFVGVCVAQYGINFALTLVAKQFIKMHLVYTVIVTLNCMVVSYLGHSLFSFGKKFAKNRKD